MQVTGLFLAALAALPGLARALPTSGTENDPGYIETIVYKRDDVLTPRDIDLAKRHNVDLNQMFRHSLVRRSDGDDITIWVHNSWQEDEAPPAHKPRQLPLDAPWFESRFHQDQCSGSSFTDRTNSRSPFTGGVQTMRNWGASRNGGFELPARSGQNMVWWSIVIAGSNSGGDAFFYVGQSSEHWNRPMRIGSLDISDLCRDSLTRFQRQFSGSWRVEAEGVMPCATGFSSGSQQSVRVRWYIASSRGPI